MLIAQLSDIHIGFDRGNREEANVQRLRAVIERLIKGANRPDLVLLTGDLTEHGDAESFAILAEELAALPFPMLAIPGNHDSREGLLAALPGTPVSADGFIHHSHEIAGLRLILLDTFEAGRHGGAFCEARAQWLGQELAAHAATPTLLVMHHPPFAAGIAWMDSDPREPWVARLAEVVRGQDQIVGIACGHLHRAIVSHWQGHTVLICPSTAPPVAMDLNPIDPERPDGRALISSEPPGYGLHQWDGTRLTSHFEWLNGLEPLARFEPHLQGMVRALMAERPE